MMSEHSVSPKVENKLFPLFLKLENFRVLLVGCGKVGVEKLHAIHANAPATKVIVVAENIDTSVVDVEWLRKYYEVRLKRFGTEDLENIDIVFVAIDDVEESARIHAAARAENLLVNVADKPELCDFYLSSVVQKGNLKIAISTNGKSPTVAKRLKEILSESLPNDIDQLLENMSVLRGRLDGDFEAKVKKLNKVTASLVEKSTTKKRDINWKKIAYACLIGFGLMILGYLLFSALPTDYFVTQGKSLIQSLDKTFYLMILAGFLAQIVDGLLGMGYGVTSAAVLLGMGVPLPAISGSIHTAEMFSSAASGFSHYKFGNVNKKLFKYLVVPGVIGSVVGALLLSYFGERYASVVKPIVAFYTLILGVRILYSAFKKNKRSRKVKNVGILALVGGFLDSFGGGGWGPVVTSTLISKGKTPRFVIGSVSLAEFFITFASAIAFFSMIGLSHWQVIAGLIIGGVLAAPIAARLAGKLPIKTMFIAIGILIVLWSANVFLKTLNII